MKEERKKDILLICYVLAVAALAVLYFSVPERKDFFDFQLKWWGEMLQAVASFF